MTDCLLIIDVQNGFVSKETEHVLDRIKDLCDSGRFDHIVSTKFVNREDGPYVRLMGWRRFMDDGDTDLIGFVEEASERIFVKNVYTAVNREFLDYLDEKHIDEIYLAGIDTDCCVLKTAADLFERNLDFKVVSDCTASNGGQASHDAGMKVMERLIGKSNIIRS